MTPQYKSLFLNKKNLFQMKKLVFMSITMIFSACQIGTPLTIEPPKNNNTYNVEYLFEHEGCKVYRFRDRGQSIRNATNLKKQ